MTMYFIKVWLRNARVWQKHIKASLIGNLGEPFLFLAAMGYGLGRSVADVEGMSYLEFIAPGLVVSTVMHSAAFETAYGSYTRLTTQQTFLGILMTPVSVMDLAIGEILWGATKGLMAGLVVLACLPFFGVSFSWTELALVPALFVEGLCFAAMGVSVTAVARSYEFFHYFLTLFITPLFLFSGILFPIKDMHPWLASFFGFFPLSHAAEVSRAFCYGNPMNEAVFWHIAVLLFYSIGMTVVAVHLLKKRIIT